MLRTRTFARYLIIGTVIGLSAVAMRAMLEVILGANPVAYGTSVLIVYLVAIVASYLLQGCYTFGRHMDAISQEPSRFIRFAAIACFAGAAATGLAAALRFLTPLAILPSQVAGAMAFGIASVSVSVMSYTLNARFVFASRVWNASATSTCSRPLSR